MSSDPGATPRRASSRPPEGLVWHYTNATGLLAIVRSHALWATASEFLNDRDEVTLGRERMEEELAGRVSAGDDFARQVWEGSRERRDVGHVPSPFFILSAAEHWDLLAMWRCYGGAGESYAIGLDAGEGLQVLVDPSAAALAGEGTTHVVQRRPWTAVRYTAESQRALVTAVFDGMEDELAVLRARVARDGTMSHAAVLDSLGGTVDNIEQALAYIKHEGFRDEREVRHCTVFLHPAELHAWAGVVRYRGTPFGMAPHIRLTGRGPGAPPGSAFTTSPAPLPVRAVAISPSPNGVAAEQSLQAMLTAHGYDVEVRRSQIPFRG